MVVRGARKYEVGVLRRPPKYLKGKGDDTGGGKAKHSVSAVAGGSGFGGCGGGSRGRGGRGGSGSSGSCGCGGGR